MRAYPIRFLSTAVLCCALVSPLSPLLIGSRVATANATRSVRLANAPIVNVAAFQGQGHLAFTWGGTLYVLDGQQRTLRKSPETTPVASFAWSHDGRWLAYIAGNGQLWLVRDNGSQAHRVTGLPGTAQSFAWSPATDLLAVSLQASGHVSGNPWLVTPVGRPHRASAPALGIWSPDGTRFAYGETLPFTNPISRSDALYTVSAIGGAPTRQLLAPQSGIMAVGWWPNGKGLLFRRDPDHSESIAADGLPLFTMPLGGKPRLLATSLGYDDWMSFSPSGREMLLTVGGGRESWHDKYLSVCDVEAVVCHVLLRQPGYVQLDNAWSPQGNHIAFVRARDRGAQVGAFGFATNSGLMAWVHTHTLWVTDAQGRGAHELAAAGASVYRPQWSGDGKHLLYIRNDALWLINANGGAPVKIVGPFPGTPNYFGFYGHPDLPIALDWSRS